MLYMRITAHRCPPPPYAMNAWTNVKDTSYGQIGFVSCMSGFRFPTGTTNITISCSHQGEWIPDNIESCEGTFIIARNYYFYQ